jgi:hypothetical protein
VLYSFSQQFSLFPRKLFSCKLLKAILFKKLLLIKISCSIFICRGKKGKNDEKLAGDIPIEEVERSPEVVNKGEPEMVRLVSREIYGSKDAVTHSIVREEFEKEKLNHI